jgi:hypothetical protein
MIFCENVDLFLDTDIISGVVNEKVEKLSSNEIHLDQ